MTTATAINPKGPRIDDPNLAPANWAEVYLGSSVGQKIIVAVCGLGLAGFAVSHMLGNLKVFQGPEAINHYAAFLKHDIGMLLWIARGGLLTIFLFHVVVAIRLRLRARSARPVGYAYQRSAQATFAAKTMFWTGIVVGVFILFHLAHFTFGMTQTVVDHDGQTTNLLELKDPLGRHDVYRMVIAGFSNAWISIFYIVAQVILFIHLSHGIPSALSTLGLVSKSFAPTGRWIGYIVGGTILIGNVLIVVAVWAQWVR